MRKNNDSFQISPDDIKNRIRSYWNKWCADYDKFHGSEEEEAWKRFFYEKFGREKQRILDVDTGAGFLSLPLAEMGHDVVGIDLSEAAAFREDIMSHLLYKSTDSAQEGDVYIISGFLELRCHPLVVSYMAKCFYTELFEDLDPEAIHQEYLTRFQHQDYDVYEHGVFVYPMP